MSHRAFVFLRQFVRLGMLTLATLLISCSATAQNVTEPLVRSLGWKLDATGQSTLAVMQAADDWQTSDGVESWGFGEAPIWIRYSLRAAMPHETESWIVRVQPAYLEDLRLYDPVSQRVLHSGLNFSSNKSTLDSLNFSFEVAALPQDRDIYLRLQSRSTRIIVTDVVTLREAVAQNQLTNWLVGFLISVFLVFALLATFQWLLTRELVIGAFALKQWVATTWALSHVGLMQIMFGSYASAEFFNTLSAFVRAATLAATLWFFVLLLKDYQPSRAWIKACWVCLVLILLTPALRFIDLAMWVGIFLNTLILVVLFLLIATLVSSSVAANQKPPLPRLFLMIYLVVYALINALPPLTILNLVPFHTIALKANLGHILLDGLLMFLLLQMRARNLTKQAELMTEQNQRIAMKLDRAQQAVAFEQQRRLEQSQFLHMLMHELKTPLSIVSLALGTRQNREENIAHAGRAVQDMKAIIDRCILADQTGEPSLPQHRQDIAFDKLLQQLVHKTSLLNERVHLTMPAVVPLVQTDAQLLKIILTNLLNNAAQYSDSLTPVSITLSVASVDDQVGLSVRISNTPGFAGWPDAKQVFSKYYRASGAQRESGSGLGLFLSRQLALSLGGMLTYVPTLRCVEFELWIPLSPV